MQLTPRRIQKQSWKNWLEPGQFAQVGLPNFATQLDMDELGLASNVNQSRRGELLNMVRQGCRGDGKMTAQVAAGCFVATCNCPENFIASRVCQRFSDAMNVVGSHNSANAHQDYIIQRDDAKSDDATRIAVFRSYRRREQ